MAFQRPPGGTAVGGDIQDALTAQRQMLGRRRPVMGAQGSAPGVVGGGGPKPGLSGGTAGTFQPGDDTPFANDPRYAAINEAANARIAQQMAQGGGWPATGAPPSVNQGAFSQVNDALSRTDPQALRRKPPNVGIGSQAPPPAATARISMPQDGTPQALTQMTDDPMTTMTTTADPTLMPQGEPPLQPPLSTPPSGLPMAGMGMVGRGGNMQQMGAGRYGGAPPPNVIARRRALQQRMGALVGSSLK